MFLDLSDDEIDAYCRALYLDLVRTARYLGSEQAVGCSPEDAVHEACERVVEFLKHGVALPMFPKNNFEIVTLDDVSRWARRRTKASFGAWKQRATRDRRRIADRPEEISDATATAEPAQEHELYDQRFLNDLLTRLRDDDLSLRVAVLICHSHVLPGTEDLDICDNTAIAKALNTTPAKVRLARDRILTTRRRIIAERSSDDEGSQS